MRYQINQVMMKMGRISTPGISSNKDMIPIKRNMTKQATIPIMSSRSPTKGRSRTANTYSMTSSITQIARVSNSYSVNTKYRAEYLSSRRSKVFST